MSSVDHANLYIDQVLDRTIPACKEVMAACQRQRDDLARQSDPAWPFRFDHTAADRICRFVEQCPHIEGPLRGQKIKLELWQCFILTTVFGWLDKETGKRRFRRAYTEVARGNGKSALSSAVSLYMLAMDGEGGSKVFSAATTRDQAKVVFNVAQAMARAMNSWRAKFGIEVGANSITQLSSASSFRPLSSEANTLDGLNIHCAIVDELHAHPNREVWDVLETGLGKRDQSLLWTITTAGTNQVGICFEVRSYVIKILNRVITDESVFGIVFTIDPDDDWEDEQTWRKANPNFGVSVNVDDLRQKARKARQIASALPAFLTKHLDVWCQADSAWLNMTKWHACANPEMDETDFENLPCVIGLDLASKLDLLSGVRLHYQDVLNEETGKTKRHYFVFAKNWIPEEAIEKSTNSHLYRGWAIEGHVTTVPGATNDYDAVEDWIRAQAKRFQVQEIAHDQYNSTSLVNHLQPEGLMMVEVPQKTLFLSPAMKELEAAVADGRFHHNADPLYTWCASNVVAHIDRNGNLFPNKPDQASKIDPIVATLMALYRAMSADGNNSAWDGEILWA